MNQQVVIVIVCITAYMVWLIVFVLAVEPWLRRLVGWLFGVTISRELQRFSGPSSNINVLDLFDAYRWKVDQPSSLSVRFSIGLFRVGFWALAVIVPLAIALCVWLAARR